MATIIPPAPLPLRRAQWRLLRPGQRVRSEWTGYSQGVVLPGAARWQVSGEFPSIVRAEFANPWIAFFAALDGVMNNFPVRAVEAPQTAAVNPVVNGFGQTGSSLNLTGLAPGPVLGTGARATVPLVGGGVQLVVLTAPLTASIAGTGTMQFRAPLRATAQGGGGVEIREPYARVALTSPAPGWDVETGQLYGFAFDAEEDFR
jgi:hypothetical protein